VLVLGGVGTKVGVLGADGGVAVGVGVGVSELHPINATTASARRTIDLILFQLSHQLCIPSTYFQGGFRPEIEHCDARKCPARVSRAFHES
jgi:hypothetical protein